MRWKNDVFVSYARVNNFRPLATEPGWVTSLVTRIRDSLPQYLPRDGVRPAWSPTFFMDDEIEGNHDFETEIFGELKESATLLVIHSKAYRESQSCRREREAFLKCLEERGESANGRIFVVEYEEKERPRELSGLRGYVLWTQDPQSQQGRTLGFPAALREDREYWNTLTDLARELGQELGRLMRASRGSGLGRGRHESPSLFPSSGPPSASVRVVFGATTDFRSLPHDLATAWALSRGSSLGVITGQSRGSLLRLLTDAETALSSACSGAVNVCLPGRAWLAAPNKHSRVPGNLEEAVAACAANGFGAVRTPSSSADPVFGFFFDLGEDGDGLTLQHVVSWCRALFRRSAMQCDVAALIHLAGREWREPQAVRALADRLRSTAGDVPIEWMREIPDAANPAAPAIALDRDAGPNEGALARWVRGLSPSAAAGMPAWLRPEPPGGDPDQHPPSLRAVAEEVAARCAGEPAQIRAFLHCVERGAPRDLHGLLRAFANVGGAAVQRASLSFAARADPFVDAWIDGADLRAKSLDEGWFWAADPEDGPFADDLALGLIRRARAGRDITGCQSLLARLIGARRLSREMRALSRQWLEDPLDHFERALGGQRAVLALRSGAVYDPSSGTLRRANLEQVDHWKLLLAQPIAPRALGELLHADAAKRAVFGLCTRDEWAAIAADPQRVDEIVECRGGRSLLFRS